VKEKRTYRPGKVDKDGTVTDKNGNKIGKIESDGTVKDKNGNKLGLKVGKLEDVANEFFFKW